MGKTVLFAILGISLFAQSALAGSMGNGSATSGMPGVSLQQFRNEADAQKKCPSDTIVWGSSRNLGIFYTNGAGPYTLRDGQHVRIGGFYACAADVKKAGLKIDSGSLQ